MENNVGKWNCRYDHITSGGSVFYGESTTYKEAADWLSDCSAVEDWGCGAGGFMKFSPDAIGVDGSNTVFAVKRMVDLTTYISKCEAVHMRHVLEHNYEWKKILTNALNSAERKLVVTMFIIPGGETVQIASNKRVGIDVPDLRISRSEFMEIAAQGSIEIESKTYVTKTQYGTEEIFFITIKEN